MTVPKLCREVREMGYDCFCHGLPNPRMTIIFRSQRIPLNTVFRNAWQLVLRENPTSNIWSISRETGRSQPVFCFSTRKNIACNSWQQRISCAILRSHSGVAADSGLLRLDAVTRRVVPDVSKEPNSDTSQKT